MTDATQNTQADSTLIQCLLRRKGGTQIAFGHNAATQTRYHFKPIDADDPTSPHVCAVENEDHADRFLSIPEAYRLYRGDGAVDKIPVTKGASSDTDPYKNKFDDILSIDFDNAENDTVTDWAEEMLELTPSHHAKIKEKAKKLDVEVKKGDTMTEVLRNIGKVMQEEERLASEQADKDK